MEISRILNVLGVVLLFFFCTVQTQSPETEQPGFDSELYNTKWIAIKTWINSTRLATTNSAVSPRIKLLCTNKFIDLVVVMCKQYLSHEFSIDIVRDENDEASEEEMPRFRHANHWNVTNAAATSKKLRSLLRKSLPASAIYTCCSETCNITTLVKYCPIEQRPKPVYVRSNNMIIGTLTVAHPHNHRHLSHNSGNMNGTLSRLRNNYDEWRTQTYGRAINNLDFVPTAPIPTTTSAFNYESDQSDEFNLNESGYSNGVGRNARDEQNHHQSSTSVTTTTTRTTTPTTARSLIMRHDRSPEPYAFDLRSTDILYHP